MKLHKKISSWLKDYVYMIIGAIGTIIYRKLPKHYLGHVIDGKVPVIIIPGILGKWSFMKKIADDISLLGHPVYIVPKLGYNLHTIPDSSSLVSNVIQKENLKNVILVTHSKGGLIGKHALIHHNDEKRILGMVSVATPYSGSAMAKLVPLDSFRELHNDSIIIKDLGSHTAVNKKIISISPEYDNHVWAEKGSHLEGAINITVSVHGHHKVIYDTDVTEKIKESIEKIIADSFQE